MRTVEEITAVAGNIGKIYTLLSHVISTDRSLNSNSVLMNELKRAIEDKNQTKIKYLMDLIDNRLNETYEAIKTLDAAYVKGIAAKE